MSEFDINFVIDDSNAHEFVAQIRDGEFSSGYVDRDYESRPEGFYAPRYSGTIIPRSQWPDLIRRQEEEKSSPLHVHKQAKVPILDQNGLGYCWMYGTVAGVMNRYAFAGIRPVPHLSATGPAAQGKNFQNEGGWAGEAIEYIEKYGIPTVDTWPEHYFKRDVLTEEMRVDARRHGIVKFEELPRERFDALASVLLDPIKPRPVTIGLRWMGHLMLALRVIKDGRDYFIAGANSWKETWGDRGYFLLSESKATAFEQVAIERIEVRAAA